MAEDPQAQGAQTEAPKLRLGGMALRNGLLVHGPTSWCVAVRNKDGEIEVTSGRKPVLSRGRLGRIPFLRGPLRLAEAVGVLPLARLRSRSARLPYEDPRVIATAAGVAAASAAARRLARGDATREAIVGVLGILPALAALRDRDLAAYHGAEHKAIGAYESGGNAADEPKEHRRCGSNLLVPMIALSVAGQVAVERAFAKPTAVHRGVASLLATGAAVEIFAFAERKPDAALSRAVHGTGHEIQRVISTREPTADQLAVAEAAVAELLRVEGSTADRYAEPPTPEPT